ncbi:TetR/AcrR family transcriptional regulator [Streptomyces sp. UNOC14_S4]|uniref:TetR/AcrR family transcriptional regulator n=1 Tax=Streptomyces sp. UNOC14_S4 TaxID=2872340 RepID=UPI001E38FF2C|nr:TetR family transcriptional regulator [Streptomyces sp. UNOC14_S4]MCC3767129.1 TetR family transcriptional regulator [Streptomyces sp. UNOC14_S4]
MTTKKADTPASATAAEDASAARPRPRRAPRAEERQRDAERSRALLLDAALEEFARHGLAGARVQDIAARAGVNKQLISYYFGGKDGLYRELQREWAEREALFAEETTPFEEVAVHYLERGLADPRPARLAIWRGLAGDEQHTPEEASAIGTDLERLRRARERGEISADLDPGFLRLAVMGMVMAPIVMPHTAREATGLDPRSPEFRELYGEQIRLLLRQLTTAGQAGPKESGQPGPEEAGAGDATDASARTGRRGRPATTAPGSARGSG